MLHLFNDDFAALTAEPNTVQKVPGTLRVQSAQTRKALLFEGCGTRSVPTTLDNRTVLRLNMLLSNDSQTPLKEVSHT